MEHLISLSRRGWSERHSAHYNGSSSASQPLLDAYGSSASSSPNLKKDADVARESTDVFSAVQIFVVNHGPGVHLMADIPIAAEEMLLEQRRNTFNIRITPPYHVIWDFSKQPDCIAHERTPPAVVGSMTGGSEGRLAD
ncbi:uncharacterized protein B0H18DRAFT_1029456 [Fomitopsis serialis]|uniref:uncharacterized protein n=1 Tax=Fomitopsis serialis TaxID=139415 RepID=UPI002008E1D8|nr:uncharacterized protein B0H18DRAFT_1029456 [Neoantrodia serialis]KAH9919028.1 hypothetical protein B0H18DRAFT_1029456 [Neoantrodia serialis]